jgi:hypothetical protein
VSSKKRNEEKRDEVLGSFSATYGETRNDMGDWSEAMLRGYDRRIKELEAFTMELPVILNMEESGILCHIMMGEKKFRDWIIRGQPKGNPVFVRWLAPL